MVPAMRILAVAGLLRALALTSASLTRAIGRPKKQFWMVLARLLAMGIVIYPLTFDRGMTGTAIAVLVGVSVMIPIWWVVTTDTLGGYRSERVARIAPSLIGTLLMAAVVVLLLVLVGEGPVARLMVGGFAGAFFYGLYHGVLWLIWRIGLWRVSQALYLGLRTGNPELTRESSIR